MIHRIFIALCLVALSAPGADVAGMWTGSIRISLDGIETELPHEMVLKQEGSRVTGTAGPGPEQQWPIAEARLTGKELTFEVKAPDGARFEYRLTVSGREMTGAYKMVLEGQESTAKVTVTRK